MRRAQSPFIALVVLAISAGAVFAGSALSQTSTVGLSHAQTASGQTVPASSHASDEEKPDPDDAQGIVTTGAEATPDEAAAGPDQHPDNHGAIVSAAAKLSFEDLKAACPSTFAGLTKGAYISAIARGLLVVTPPVAPTATSTTPTTPTTTLVTTIQCSSPATTQASSPTTTQTPSKLHGKANADAKKLQHKPSN